MDPQPQESPKPGITFDEVLLWLETNWKPIVVGIGMVGILGLVYVVYTSSAEAREQEATASLFSIQLKEEPKPTSGDYSRIAAETSGTGIEAHARLRAAAALYADGDYSGAQQAYDAFTREFPASPLMPEASFGIAVCLDAQGKVPEALTRYQEFTTRFEKSALGRRARVSMARLHESQGDFNQAFRLYQELASQTSSGQFSPQRPWQRDAALGLRRLLKEHPELMQTNDLSAPLGAPAGPGPIGLTPPLSPNP